MTRKQTTQRQKPPAFVPAPNATANPPDGYRVLFFSPTSSMLPGAHGEALAAIEYGDRIIAAQHPVTPTEALRQIERTPGDNLVWFFSTHAQMDSADPWASALQMDDGVLPASTLATYAKLYRPALIYLNSCQSEEIVRLVCEYAGSDGIGTIIDAPDELAYMTGRLFLQQLFATGDTKAAYALSRPANNRTYIYISGYRENAMPTQNSGGDHADLKYISEKIEGLDRAIRGDDYGSNGLIADFRQFKTDLLRYMEERKSWEHQMENWRANMESRVARVEDEQQDMAHWRKQQAQPRSTTFSSYLQVILAIFAIVAGQLLIAWVSANYFAR